VRYKWGVCSARELRTKEANGVLVPAPEVVCKLAWSFGDSWYRVELDGIKKNASTSGEIISGYSRAPFVPGG